MIEDLLASLSLPPGGFCRRIRDENRESEEQKRRRKGSAIRRKMQET